MAMSGGKRFVGRALLLVQCVLAVGIAAAFTWLATRPALKRLFDLTEFQRYTVDEPTRELLAQMRGRPEQKLEFHFFPTPMPAGFESEEERHWWGIQERIVGLTNDLLRQYAYLGGEAVLVQTYDLRADIQRSREAAKVLGQRQENVIVVKLGSRTKTVRLIEDLADIEFPDPTQRPMPGQKAQPIFREYRGEAVLSSAIKSLLVEGTPKLYFVIGHEEADFQKAHGTSYSELAGRLQQEGFELGILALANQGAIPEDAKVVALLEPRRELSEREAELLLAYLRRGGRVFVNVSYYDQPAEWNPRLAALLAPLGLELGEDLVCHMIVDPNRPNQLLSSTPAVRTLAVTGLSPSHPVTKPLLRIGRTPVLRDAREIRPLTVPPAGVRVDATLLRTGQYAWIEPRSADGVPAPAPSYRGDQKGLGERSLGAVVEVEPPDGAADPKRVGRLALVSGIAFVNLAMQHNGDLGLNLLQWLAERKELVQVRGNTFRSRGLAHVTQPQFDRLFWLLVAYVPGGLLALGLLVLWRRSR